MRLSMVHQKSCTYLSEGPDSCGLDVKELEHLLCHTIPKATGDSDGLVFEGLAYRLLRAYNNSLDDSNHSSGSNQSDIEAEFGRVKGYLDNLVSGDDESTSCASEKLPASVLSEIHFFIGQIHEMHRNYSDAAESYVKALWISRPDKGNKLLPRHHLVEEIRRHGALHRKGGNDGSGAMI